MLKKRFWAQHNKINFVFHWKISTENFRIKSYDQSYHQKVGNLENTVFFQFSKKLGVFFLFFTFWWYELSYDFILKFSRLISQWETKFILVMLCSKPFFKHYIGKTLKSHLLKKLSIKFFETQDLSNTNGKPKLLFHDYSWHIFFLQPITEGNCDVGA